MFFVVTSKRDFKSSIKYNTFCYFIQYSRIMTDFSLFYFILNLCALENCQQISHLILFRIIIPACAAQLFGLKKPDRNIFSCHEFLCINIKILKIICLTLQELGSINIVLCFQIFLELESISNEFWLFVMGITLISESLKILNFVWIFVLVYPVWICFTALYIAIASTVNIEVCERSYFICFYSN